MTKKRRRTHKFFFPDSLTKELAKIRDYPLTVIEAPWGFGKTTAVREYLKSNLTEDAREYWYTCLGESAPVAWKSICELFDTISDEDPTGLCNLEMPTINTLFYAAACFRDIHLSKRTYFVIDNYHLLDCDIPHELIYALSMHENPMLHIIIITQQLEPNEKLYTDGGNVHIINGACFFFDRTGTDTLFRMEGIRLKKDELESIYINTEGWVAAIRLQIINYIETGTFALNADIEQLIEKSVWNTLAEDEKNFLMNASVLDSFTASQAAIMLGCDTLSAEIEDLIKNNDFIKYYPNKRVYSIHNILKDYLQNRFYNYMPESFRHAAFKKAAAACMAAAQYCKAAKFFYRVRDFESIMSIPFTLEYFNRHKEEPEMDFYLTLIKECPGKILSKYPIPMICFGYVTISNGYFAEYKKLCNLIELALKNIKKISQNEYERVKGEYLLLSALGEYNDIERMKEKEKEALKLLKSPSEIIKTDTPYMFSSVSLLNIFWRETGGLDTAVKNMKEGIAIHKKITGNNGAGADYALQAETAIMRGEDDTAEILCHKALYDAGDNDQTGISICTELILARIALLRKNPKDFFTAVSNIRRYAKCSRTPYILRQAEYSLSIVSLLLNVKDCVAPWLYDMGQVKKMLFSPSVPIAQTPHLHLMLIDNRFNQFYGICHLALDAHKAAEGNARYVMPQLHKLILYACAKYKNGEQLEAQRYLKEALNAALPDRIFLPFAQQPCMERLLNEMNICYFGEARECKRNFDTLIALCRRQQEGVREIKRAVFHKSPLSPREREIALLAKKRLTAKEIGERLCISDMTVRATLRSVYKKLNIHSRAELIANEF